MENDENKRVDRKRSLRHAVLLLTLVMLIILAVLSIVAAFLGAEEAAEMFGSPACVVFWIVLTVLFVGGFAAAGNLLKKPGLFLSHAGCILILVGAMWGSERALRYRNRYLDEKLIHRGFMQIFEGDRTSIVANQRWDALAGRLPFEIRLNDFWIEYYMEGASLDVEAQDGRKTTMEPVAGASVKLGDDLPELKVVKVFCNFRVSMEGGKREYIDLYGAVENPALQVEMTMPDGKVMSNLVFPGTAQGHSFPYGGLKLVYTPGAAKGIRDYKSDLTVIDGGFEKKRKVIEVNKPLHYGGYDFYQSSYDSENGVFTVLSVSCNSGLMAVYAGYILLCAGVIWQCWIRHLPGYLRKRR